MAEFNLTITPGQTEFLLKPGVTLIQAYQITNNSTDTLSLNTQILPWIPLSNDGRVSYDNVVPAPEINFSLSNADLKLSQPFELKPQESRQLVLKISSNSNTPLGDYYYTFFITQNLGQLQQNDNITQSYGKIGSHLLLSVSNTASPQTNSQIQNFSVTTKIKDIFFTPLTFQANIKNNSDYFFKTNGVLTLNKGDLKINELNLKNNNVLAHHSRTLECQDKNICTISPPFWPGRYTATLTLDPSLNATPVTLSFYIFPFSFVGLIIFIVGVTLLTLKIRQRFRKPKV